MKVEPGTRLGPYEIVGPIGAGGTGEVYRANDARLGREVAITALPSHLSDNPELTTRFEREAEAISQLTHPHICTLYDVARKTAPTSSSWNCSKGNRWPTFSQRARFRPSKVLFENHEVFTFAAAKDGKRFIAAENPNPGAEPRLDIVVNWFADVRCELP
jgi:serine/threonine protein kinase